MLRRVLRRILVLAIAAAVALALVLAGQVGRGAGSPLAGVARRLGYGASPTPTHPVSGLWAFKATPVPTPQAQIEENLRQATFYILTGDTESQVPHGTGFVVDSDGTMITALHVLDLNDNSILDLGERPVKVHAGERAPYWGSAFRSSAAVDVAVVRLWYPQRADWPYIPLGDSRDVRPGTPVFALSYDWDWDQATLRRGHIVERTAIGGRVYFVVDVPTFPGASGGPVVATDGSLVGVLLRTHKEEGFSLAVPSEYIPMRHPRYGQVVVITPTPGDPLPFRSHREPDWEAIFLTREVVRTQTAVALASPPSPSFGAIVFSEGIEADYQPKNPGTRFAAGIPRVYASFTFEGMSSGVRWTYAWYQGGEQLWAKTDAWQWGRRGPAFLYCDGLPKGGYELRLFIDEVLQQSASFIVE